MAWSLSQDPHWPYVEGIFNGKTSWHDIKELTNQCIEIQKAQGVIKFLIETSEMQPTATVTDVFELPANEYRNQKVDRRTQIAVVYSPSGESEELVSFYETACVNRGWRAKSFTSKQEAISWLESST